MMQYVLSKIRKERYTNLTLGPLGYYKLCWALVPTSKHSQNMTLIAGFAFGKSMDLKIHGKSAGHSSNHYYSALFIFCD